MNQMQKEEWEEIQKKLAEKGPSTTRLPPSNVLKLAIDHVEVALRDLKRIVREWESGVHDDFKQPNTKVQTSENFYHGWL